MLVCWASLWKRSEVNAGDGTGGEMQPISFEVVPQTDHAHTHPNPCCRKRKVRSGFRGGRLFSDFIEIQRPRDAAAAPRTKIPKLPRCSSRFMGLVIDGSRRSRPQETQTAIKIWKYQLIVWNVLTWLITHRDTHFLYVSVPVCSGVET